MLQKFLMIISYGALLLLLMPPSGLSIMLAAVLFVLGAPIMAFKKIHKSDLQKGRRYVLLLSTLFFIIPASLGFFDRWIRSSKILMVASMVQLSAKSIVWMVTVILSVFSVYFIYVIMQLLVRKLSSITLKFDCTKSIMFSIAASIVTVILVQLMIEVEVFSMGYIRFMWAVLIVSAVTLFLYCLIGRTIPSIMLGSGLFMILSTVNAYVLEFRGRMFEPVDVFSVGTALNVAGNYSLFPIPRGIWTCWGLFAAL